MNNTMSDAKLPAPPRNVVQAVLEARQAAAAAEQSAAFCQHRVHQLEATMRDCTSAYMAALRKCQEQTARAENTMQIVRICTWAILGINIVSLVLYIVRLLQ